MTRCWKELFIAVFLTSCVPIVSDCIDHNESSLIDIALASIEAKKPSKEINSEVQTLLKCGHRVSSPSVGDIQVELLMSSIDNNPPRNYQWLTILFDESKGFSVGGVSIACSYCSEKGWLYGGRIKKIAKKGSQNLATDK